MSRAHARLDRRRWEAVRVAVFTRDSYRCTRCGRPGRLEADHVVPLEKGGAEYDLSNITTLCRPCHFLKTAGESGRVPIPGAAAWAGMVRKIIC